MKTHKISGVVRIVLIGIFLIFLLLYLYLSYYYSKGYSFKTYINGHYCTGLSVEEVNQILLEEFSLSDITVIGANDTEETIQLNMISHTVDYSENLKKVMDSQNSFLWIRNYFKNEKFTVGPAIVFDGDELKAVIENLECMQGTTNETPDVRIEKTEEGYKLVDTTKNLFNYEKAYELIKDAILNGAAKVDLVQEGCIYDFELTPEMEEDLALYEKLEEFQDFHMNYLMGEEVITVGAPVVCEWLVLDEHGKPELDSNGELIFDEELLYQYVDDLFTPYDTYGISRIYHTYDGKDVEIKRSIYGNQIDHEAEKEYLLNAFLTKDMSDREPVYLEETAIQKGLDDIGDTFIEVNVTQQKLYYIKENEIVFTTDVVTGNMRNGTATPSVICYIQGLYRDRTLVGATYRSFVHYWVPVYRGIGLHDATWRSSFGGQIYLTNGSHGCVNIKLSVMKELYPMLEKGIPVIIYYES